jgi:hypothetical protein
LQFRRADRPHDRFLKVLARADVARGNPAMQTLVLQSIANAPGDPVGLRRVTDEDRAGHGNRFVIAAPRGRGDASQARHHTSDHKEK